MVTGTTFESVAVYVCNDGYELGGVHTRECLGNATWSASEPTCDRKPISRNMLCVISPGLGLVIATENMDEPSEVA